MKRIKLLLTAVLLLGLLVSPAVVTAAPIDDVRTGVNLTGAPGSQSVDSVIAAAINILSIVVGVIAVIMVIIGGLKYILSSGDSNNINSAKNTILYAIIGLVVVAFAQVIVRFVLDKVG